MIKLLQTRNLEQFTLIDGNREIKPSHKRHLIRIYSVNPKALEWHPIVVNEKMEVIDGQHRLAAAKALDLPLSYLQVLGLGLSECQALNSNAKQWTPTDFAKAFCKVGKENYCKYLEFKKKWGFNHDVAMRYLSLNEPVTVQSFKDGELPVPNYSRSNRLAKLLEETGQYVVNYKLRAIALGFLRLVLEEDLNGNTYNHDEMMRNLEKIGPLADKLTQSEEADAFWRSIYSRTEDF